MKNFTANLLHVFFNVGVDQVEESTMSFTEERILWNFGSKLLELRRDSHKVDLNSFSAE